MLRTRTLSGLTLLLLVAGSSLSVAAPPKNVILMIGDGMGPEQVKAAGMYLNGAAGTLNFESFPSQAVQTTFAANSSVTDSAAAGTAMATGVKVNNGVISLATPGDGSELPTMLEIFKAQGKSTGLVTTTYLTHATPASFGAHETSRHNNNQIGQDYLNQTRPNVLFGGGHASLDAADINNDGGYTLVENREELNALDTGTETFVAGLFGSGHLRYEYNYAQGTTSAYDTLPHLSEMTSTALEILDNDPDGFFLMVESGRIDHAGHSSNSDLTLKTGRNIFETIEFANTIQKVIDWANLADPGLANTLILVTADHETGDLTVTENNPTAGVLPAVTWGSTSHTGINVPLVAIGVNSHLVSGVHDNTDLLGIVLASTPTLGDFNGDGTVDAADYTVWRDNQGGDNSTLNGNGDESGGSAGVVDAADYTAWVNNFGTVAGSTVASSTNAVPEPGDTLTSNFCGGLLDESGSALAAGLSGLILYWRRNAAPRLIFQVNGGV